MTAYAKSRRRNVMASVALTAGSTNSVTEQASFAKGVRFFITCSTVTASGGTDKLFLCALPPNGGAALPMVGFSAINMLSTAGTYTADFYPGAWLPPTIAAGGVMLGAAGIELPMQWCVQVVLGTANAATIAIDAEMLP